MNESDDVVVVVVEFCFDSITGISSNPSHVAVPAGD